MGLSPKQYRLAEHLNTSKHVSVDDAAYFNQNTFGSLCRRGLVAYNHKLKTFSLNDDGVSALHVYAIAEFYRKLATDPMGQNVERLMKPRAHPKNSTTAAA